MALMGLLDLEALAEAPAVALEVLAVLVVQEAQEVWRVWKWFRGLWRFNCIRRRYGLHLHNASP